MTKHEKLIAYLRQLFGNELCFDQSGSTPDELWCSDSNATVNIADVAAKIEEILA